MRSTPTISGVDFSSKAIHIATIPLNPDAGTVWPRWDAYPLPGGGVPIEELCQTAGTILIAHTIAVQPAQLVVERPWTRQWNSANLLLPLFGALITAADTLAPTLSLTVAEWRKELGLPANTKKPHIIQYALTQLLDEPITPLDDNAAEAFLIALAARSILTRAHDQEDIPL